LLIDAVTDWFYLGALVAALAAAVLCLAGRGTLGRWAGLASAAALAVCLVLITRQAQRPPLYGPLEGLVVMTFWLAVLGWWHTRSGHQGERLGAWVWPMATLLLGMLLFTPRELNPDFYMYDDPWVILFFQLRLTSTILLVFAGLNYLAWLAPRPAPDDREALLKRGRNFIFLGAAVFLGGEFSGCVWAFLWLGDYWRWSGGFFESTLMFLVILLPLHLPQRWAASPPARALTGALPGTVLLGLLLAHQWTWS
jgi:hypothetical protein